MRLFFRFFCFAFLFTGQLFSIERSKINEYVNKDISALKFSNPRLLKHLSKNLKKNHYLHNKKQDNPIPKILHFIWLGPRPIPETNQICIQSWKDLHPTWEIKLWTDNDLKDVDPVLLSKILECKNYGLKSDILRYDILYKYGGLYVDVDFFCKKPFDILCESHSFFAGSFTNDTIMNSIIGVMPNHPLLRMMISNLRKKNIPPLAEGDQVQHLTGPFFLSEMISEFETQKNYNSDIVIYPTNYFFANGHNIVRTPRSRVLSELETSDIYNKRDVFAVHIFTNTWINR